VEKMLKIFVGISFFLLVENSLGYQQLFNRFCTQPLPFFSVFLRCFGFSTVSTKTTTASTEIFFYLFLLNRKIFKKPKRTLWKSGI